MKWAGAMDAALSSKREIHFFSLPEHKLRQALTEKRRPKQQMAVSLKLK
jgi:hypothetical protein